MKVEFHCHSVFSKDSLTPPERLIAAARRKGIDRLVITDHNSINGALAAFRLAPDLVIIGEEIKTTRGELLASFVSEEIPRGLAPQEAIRRLRDQGAFISVSHPFDMLRNGHWQEPDLLEIAPLVDAIEVFNARCMKAEYNLQAQNFARSHDLPGTAGSDGHAAFEVGTACLALPPFESADDLRRVIRQGEVLGRLSSPLVHFVSRYASLRKQIRV